jgi:4-hydroxy-tetrahydrodipicolinate synthase
MSEARLAVGGIWAAVITPVTPDLTPDAQRAIPYYRDLLASGCDGINLLGTTGEAMSFSATQRLQFMERIAASGLPLERVMAGTGAASLDDAARLTRFALERGFAAALIMPPFFFREASDDGIAAFYEALLERVNAPARSLLLYNFPRMAGVTLHASLVERIARSSKGGVFGMKDSSNDAALQSDALARLPEFVVLPGSESDLVEAKRRGCAGCVSGSVALWAPLAKRVFEREDEGEAAELRQLRASLEGLSLVPVMRRRIAELRNDPEWERAVPPLQPASSDAFRLAGVYTLAERVLEDPARARAWFKERNRALDGERPLDLLDTEAGVQRVVEVLNRIE